MNTMQTTQLAAVALGCAFHATAAAQTIPATYDAALVPQIDDTSDPNALTYTWPYAINNAQTIVGALGNDRGFVWSPSAGPALLTTLLGEEAEAATGVAIDNQGNLIGTYRPTGGLTLDALGFHLSAAGRFETLKGPNPDTIGLAFGMNDRGMLVGSDGFTSILWRSARGGFVSKEIGGLGGFFSEAVAINRFGVVAGNSNTPAEQAIKVYRWTAKGGFEPLPRLVAGAPASATDINDSGIVVGRAAVSLFQNKPAYWDARGSLHVLPSLQKDVIDVVVLAVNNASTMVGFEAIEATGSSAAVLWVDDAIYDLNALTANLPAGYELLRATSINERGEITAEARTFNNGRIEDQTVVLTPR